MKKKLTLRVYRVRERGRVKEAGAARQDRGAGDCDDDRNRGFLLFVLRLLCE